MAAVAVEGDPGYQVEVGHALLHRVGETIEGALRVAVIHPPNLQARAAEVRAHLVDREVVLIEVPDAERQKTAQVAAGCWSELGAAGFTRSDAIVGLGGGATTDLAGFVAATWLRGVRVVQLPTSLLAMVDAAVGGKTGINTSEGKNLVGAFHPPVAVICDLDLLVTLPREDLVAGMAEVVKVGFTHDPVILDLIEANPAQALDPIDEVLPELVQRAVAVKASVVGGDLRELRPGGREVLNYGHTLGHAIERVERYSWRHGAAVAVGLVYAAELGRLAGVLDPIVVRRHRSILESLGLPTSYPKGRWTQLYDAMSVDKKKRGNALRFIVLAGLARPSALDSPDPALLAAAFEEVAS